MGTNVGTKSKAMLFTLNYNYSLQYLLLLLHNFIKKTII